MSWHRCASKYAGGIVLLQLLLLSRRFPLGQWREVLLVDRTLSRLEPAVVLYGTDIEDETLSSFSGGVMEMAGAPTKKLLAPER
ncbi:hypothetical protein BDZ89DRAFT_1065910 [Hymenopellis radicata]|nr:hypothetical protein BDZ89DRAFT_1065910 [Hymenopellis radicata]